MDRDRAPGEEPCRRPGTLPGGRAAPFLRQACSLQRTARGGTRWPAGPPGSLPRPASLFQVTLRSQGGAGSSVSGMGLTQNIKKVCLRSPAGRWAGPPCASMLSHSHQNSPDGPEGQRSPRGRQPGPAQRGPALGAWLQYGARVTRQEGQGRGPAATEAPPRAPPPPFALHCGLGA